MALKDDGGPDWPFAWEAAARLLDTDLIQKQGDFFLRRGLSIRRLVAFVGSGTSMAYGRVSWAELAETQVSGIIEAIGDAPREDPVGNLIAQLKALSAGVKEEKAEAIILAMQIAEQIWMLADERSLDALRAEFHPVHDKAEGPDTPNDQSKVGAVEVDLTTEKSRRDLFRKSIKAETVDETHHIRRIFSDPFRESGKEGDAIHKSAKRQFTHGVLRRDPRGQRKSFVSIFSKTFLEEVAERVESVTKETGMDSADFARICSARLLKLSQSVADALVAECQRTNRHTLNPFHFSAFGLILDSVRVADKLKADCASIRTAIEENLKTHASLKPTKPDRTNFVAREKDPLWQLAMTLDVKRFLTTNYDLEIERLIDDIGFEQTSYSTQEQIDRERIEQIGPLGGRAREIVLDDNNSADLLDFAASPGPYNIQVAHLHGRATENEDIVLTERDYQSKYLGNEPHKIVAREGLDVLFGGNPILFIGVSLSEGDVVRPLREFASSLSRRNHSVVALMAATADEASRKRFVMEQYIRHGIYVLHYGKQDNGSSEAKYWLERLFDYTKKLTEFLDFLADEKNHATMPGDNEFDLPRRAVKEARSKALEIDVLESDGAPCSVALECQLLNVIWEFLEADKGELRRGVDKEVARKFYGTVLRRAVKRIEGAVHTAALTSYLRGLERRWHERGVGLLPPRKTRLDDLRFSTWSDLGGGSAQHNSAFFNTRWFRHLVRDRRYETDQNDWQRPAARIGSTEFREILGAWQARYGKKKEKRNSRVLLIAAPRGAGKGSLHGTFAIHGDHLLEPPKPKAALPSSATRHYAAQFSASFSFSSEIGSVWDGMAAFLIDPDHEARRTVASPAWRKEAGRIERIRTALERLASRSNSTEKRILVILQAFDLLFEPNGYAKNAEIRAICDMLFDPDSSAPIDFVLIVRDTRVPLYFRSGTSTALLRPSGGLDAGRVLRLLARPPGAGALSDRARISTAIVKAGVKIDTHGDLAAKRSFAKSIPDTNQGKASGPDYIYFLCPKRADAQSRDGDVGQADELLHQNRFHLNLFERVEEDAGPSVELRNHMAREMIDATGRENRISSDRFFEKILDYWAARAFDSDRDCDALLNHLKKSDYAVDATFVDVTFKEEIGHAHDIRLQELLLRHLAVISQPVEADVLARCPQIKIRAGRLCGKTDNNPESVECRKRIVECGLALLSRRGLCFTIFGRHPEPKDWGHFRYQVHRAMQLHIHRRLGGQNAEPPEGYFFSLSLYASQGRDLPLLSANAYAFLHDLMNELIGFPQDDGRCPDEKSDTEHHARCLRASIGVARTLFSIGVVARFNDLGGVNVPLPPRPGYFEHHRLTLRWMLREAQRIASDAVQAEREGSNKEKIIKEWMPYYPDELAWLYNECGVFSLAQGQSFDALAMFDAALRVAKGIEGEGDQPIRRRIMLNLAVCAINRGRPNEARRLLGEITGNPDEDRVVLLVAEGYLGVLEHIEGNHDAAHVRYKTAIEGLTDLGRSRAVSLFLRCRGDLYRHKRDFELADRDFSNAIDRARLSGSEDMSWFAIVARVRMEIAQETDFKSVLKKLEGADAYAEAMELPQLAAEVSFVHAQILLRQGETALAGERCTRALCIATLNGLTIRAIAYRSLLSDIHRARGWESLAHKIKANALHAARNAGYRLLLQRHPTDGSPDDDDDRTGYPSRLSRRLGPN